MNGCRRAPFEILLIAIVFLPSFTKAQPPLDLYHRQAVIAGTGLDEPYNLPDGLLIEDSETVSLKDSLLIRDQDYRIDYIRGIIRFSGILTVTDTVKITYQVFPFELRTSYFSPIQTIRPDEVAETDTVQLPPSLPGSSVLETGSLRKSGTLVRGITIGSDRDLSVESGLNLQVEGRLGRNVDVLALLSDQNTPIQPEGNTATIEEIDKVLIQVQSPHLDATLGDYDLQFEGSRFAGYYRKLEGARLDGRTGDERMTLSGAISKGQYHSNFFYGQEGNQGPYRLTDKEGRAGILVLAGTEKVWLDGQRLQRGENNDYTIEYGLGEITFTPRRLITSDSRITVDFQYSADSYSRDIYAANAEAHILENRLGLRATLVSESDSRNNPLSFVLTDSTRAAIAMAGDDPTKAEVLQVDSVTVGEGDYILEEVSWGGQIYEIFTYVGPDSIGYLNVVFSYVGQGQGDYERVASGTGFHYAWVGPGEGDYAPVSRLPLPERRRLGDVEIWGNPTRTLSFKMEGAVSELDRNTFSDQDDNDNVGIAWSADGHWQSSPGQNPDDFSRLELDAHARQVDSKFSQIDRYQQVEYSRQWDLDEEASDEESVQEASMTIRPFHPWWTKIGYGFLDKEADGFRSERWEGETRLSGENLPVVTAKADWVRSSSDVSGRTGLWTRGLSTASYKIWRLTPRVRYEREHKKDAYSDSLGGFLFNDYTGGLNYAAGPLSLDVSQALREDQKYSQNRLKDFSTARTGNYKAGLSYWHNLTVEALYTHRTKDFQQADSAQTRTDLIEINLGWAPFHRSINLLANYRINNTQVSTIVQTPVYVGPGQGTHVKVGDLYFEDPDGEYILVAQSTGDFQPVVELEGSLSLDVDPHRLPKKDQERLPSPWRFLSSQTLLNFNEKTKDRDTWALYRLDFSRFQGDSTLQGNLLLREDLFLFRHRRDLSFRLRGQISQSLSNLYLSGGQETKRRSVGFRVRRSFSEKWSAQTDLNRETDVRTYRATNVSSRDIGKWEIALEPIFRPTRQWEIGMRLIGQRDKDSVEDLLSYRYGLEPRLVRNFARKGRGELRFEWHHVSTDTDALPYEMASGDPPGDNFRWDVRLDYRISKYMTATLSYNGSKDADRDAIHIGQAEVRAFF